MENDKNLLENLFNEVQATLDVIAAQFDGAEPQAAPLNEATIFFALQGVIRQIKVIEGMV